jgi:hypothetical protein
VYDPYSGPLTWPIASVDLTVFTHLSADDVAATAFNPQSAAFDVSAANETVKLSFVAHPRSSREMPSPQPTVAFHEGRDVTILWDGTGARK